MIIHIRDLIDASIMFPFIFLMLWLIVWLIIQIMIVKKEKIQFFKKILDNTIFNVIVVIGWVVFVFLLIPFSHQRLITGQFTLILDLFGQILIVLGIITFIWLFIQKRGIGAQEMGKLLTKGAYGISRHPIYLGHMFVFFGLVFERGAFDALILSPIIIFIYIITAKIEEKFSIGNIFKEEYEIYRKKVPMFMKWWLFLIILIIFIIFLF